MREIWRQFTREPMSGGWLLVVLAGFPATLLCMLVILATVMRSVHADLWRALGR